MGYEFIHECRQLFAYCKHVLLRFAFVTNPWDRWLIDRLRRDEPAMNKWRWKTSRNWRSRALLTGCLRTQRQRESATELQNTPFSLVTSWRLCLRQFRSFKLKIGIAKTRPLIYLTRPNCSKHSKNKTDLRCAQGWMKVWRRSEWQDGLPRVHSSSKDRLKKWRSSKKRGDAISFVVQVDCLFVKSVRFRNATARLPVDWHDLF